MPGSPSPACSAGSRHTRRASRRRCSIRPPWWPAGDFPAWPRRSSGSEAMADPMPAPDERLSDGLLLLRGDARFRSQRGVVDDRDDVYLLREVADPDAAPRACAVVRRVGDHAAVRDLAAPAELLGRLVREICDALRADGVSSLAAGPEVPVAIARTAGIADPISL